MGTNHSQQISAINDSSHIARVTVTTNQGSGTQHAVASFYIRPGTQWKIHLPQRTKTQRYWAYVSAEQQGENHELFRDDTWFKIGFLEQKLEVTG